MGVKTVREKAVCKLRSFALATVLGSPRGVVGARAHALRVGRLLLRW